MFAGNDEDSEKIFSALQHLKYNKHEVIIFHVTDKIFEQEFAFTNRPYKFVDLETGQILKLNPNEIRETYIDRTNKLVKELNDRCGQYMIDIVEADINKGFDEVLKPYLLKRAKYY